MSLLVNGQVVKSDVTPGDWTPSGRYIGVRVNLGRGQEVKDQ